MSLNLEQQNAIEASIGPCLLIAGAGTGKTTVLVKRFQCLIEKSIKPEQIVFLTFTNKAMNEINRKISDVFHKDETFLNRVKVSTFHIFCIDILKSEGIDFVILDNDEVEEYVKEIIDRLSLLMRADEITNLILRVRWFENVKKRTVNIDDFIEVGKQCLPNFKEEIIKKYSFEEFQIIRLEYERFLEKNNFLHFDDILFETLSLLENESKRIKFSSAVKAILFDEFQDIDEIQFEIIKKLIPKKGNIFCVGDPDQAIYGFRNALSNPFKLFEEYFDNVKIFKLKTSYRSTLEILNICNKLMKNKRHDYCNDLVPSEYQDKGEPVRLFITNSHKKEIQEVIDNIFHLNRDKGVKLKQIAILFRSWTCGTELSRALIEENIPFFSEDSKNIWNKDEIRDLIAYLTLAFEDDIYNANKALLRIINRPARKFGPKSLAKLKEEAYELKLTLIKHLFSEQKIKSDLRCARFFEKIWKIREIAKSQKDLQIRVKEIFEEMDLFSYFEGKSSRKRTNIDSFLSLIVNSKINNFKEFQKWLRDMTKFTKDKDAIYFSTIHHAKGVEFDNVFVIQMNEGKFPSVFENEKLIDEERRVAYVAFTRARKRLFLSSSNGEEQLSRFIEEIEAYLLKKVDLVIENFRTVSFS